MRTIQQIPNLGKLTAGLLWILVSIVFAIAPFALAEGQIQWRNVTAGLDEGKRSHKYVLADVYTEWCGWCKKLDRDTFSDKNMIYFLNEKFVCVKANAEDHGPGQELAYKYGVNSYPCSLVFDQNGKLIGKVFGYKEAQEYQADLQNILNNKN